MTFVMTGGGTGGHVIPALAVARELRQRGHQVYFIGTRQGMESRLVPADHFEVDWVEIGGLQRVGAARAARSLLQLPISVMEARRSLKRRRPAAMFSMGGYVAAPAMMAALWRRIPFIVMEPNALPGMVNRRMGRFAARALVNFSETAAFFPKGRSEVTGVPVRDEFFRIAPKPRGKVITVLITGGSQGSRTLNRAAREVWPLLRQSAKPVRLIHQTGRPEYEEIAGQFAGAGIEGRIEPFINDMPAAFAESDVIVCRSGAGAVAELAAAGKPSILVPFPFAADDHQTRNAEAMQRAEAARLVADREWNGRRMFDELTSLMEAPGLLESMAGAARRLARPGAALRAADLLEQLGNSH